MAVIISDSSNTSYDGNINTSNGFYRVENYNLGSGATVGLSLSSVRYINVTFAHSGNCKGIVLGLTHGFYPITYSVIVKLQEYNGSSWIDKASKVLSPTEIMGEPNPSTTLNGRPYCSVFVPFEFETPYAVDTSSNKYRFYIYRDNTSGSSGTWYLLTSDKTNPFYATWCDNQVSFTNDDTLVIKDKIIINDNASIASVLGTGTTDYGICAIACRQNDYSKANVCNLVWEENPTVSHTFTVKGTMMFGLHSGFRVGTEDNPIPSSAIADIYFAQPNVGSITLSGIRTIWGSSSTSTHSSRTSFFFYGEIPSITKTTLSEDANSGQAHLITEDDVSSVWQAGDYVVAGKQDVSGQGSITLHEISSISGNDITLTANLASYKRLAGGTVLRLNGYGIRVRGFTSSAYGNINPLNPSNFVFSGCEFINARLYPQYASYYYVRDSISYRSQYLVQDCTSRTDKTGLTYLLYTPFVPQEGMVINRVHTFRQATGTGSAGFSNAYIKSGYLEYKNCCVISSYSTTWGSTTATTKLSFHDNRLENSYRYGVLIQGLSTICTDNYFWGIASSFASSYYSFYVGQVINPIEIGRNIFNKCGAALIMGAYPKIKCVDKDDIFGNESPNTIDIGFFAGALMDYELFNPSGVETIEVTYLPDTIPGSRFRITNYNGIINDDRNWLTNGKIVRTGYNLADTTVHTEGNDLFAMKFIQDGSSNPLDFEQNVPIGNCQNKDVALSVWVNIASDNYYSAEDYQLPRLTIIYDNGTEVYQDAQSKTGWQKITVPFTPYTSYGQVSVKVGGYCMSETESDRHFYVDDFTVFYPAGTSLNLGGLDLWASGLPITPAIATNLSPADVWSLPNQNFGIGSVGNLIRDNLDAKVSDKATQDSVDNLDIKIDDTQTRVITLTE